MTTASLPLQHAPAAAAATAPVDAPASPARRVATYVVAVLALAIPVVVSRVFVAAPPWAPAASGVGFAVLATLISKSGRILIPFGAALAGLATFIVGYGQVAYDNPTAGAMTIVVDDAIEIELAPWGNAVAYLPAGEHRFTARAGDQRDAFSGSVAPHGTHLASPTGRGCYGLFEHVYGALSGADVHGDEHLEGKRWYDLEHVDYMFERAPSSVSSKSSGEAKRELLRAYCNNGSMSPDDEVGVDGN